jgi:hypothetical protein
MAASNAFHHRIRSGAKSSKPHAGQLLAAIVTATLLITGAWLADELAEGSQSCYPPDGGCEARGVRIPTVGFDEMMSNR